MAVLEALETLKSAFAPGEVKTTLTRGSGPGGQHRNKVETCVVATHEPTGLSVRIDGRSQAANRKMALAILAAKLSEERAVARARAQNRDRQTQVGSGMRGDKIRTYRVRDDQAVDHRTGEKMRLSAWLRGEAF